MKSIAPHRSVIEMGGSMLSFLPRLPISASLRTATLAFLVMGNFACGDVHAEAPTVDLTELQEQIRTLQNDVEEVKAGQQQVAQMLQPVFFAAYLAVSQTIPTEDVTRVAFDNVERDTHSAFDVGSHTYIVPMNGVYAISTTLTYLEISHGRANATIRVNDKSRTEATAQGNSSGIGSTLLRIKNATFVELEAGDRVEVTAYHDYGSDRTLDPDVEDTNVQIARFPFFDLPD